MHRPAHVQYLSCLYTNDMMEYIQQKLIVFISLWSENMLYTTKPHWIQDYSDKSNTDYVLHLISVILSNKCLALIVYKKSRRINYFISLLCVLCHIKCQSTEQEYPCKDNALVFPLKISSLNGKDKLTYINSPY